MSDKVQDRASSIGNVDSVYFRPNIQTVTLPCYCRWFGSRQQLEHHSTFLVPLLRPCSSVSLSLNLSLRCNISCHCPRRCCHTRRNRQRRRVMMCFVGGGEAILATHVNITIDIFQILQARTGSLRCNLSILLDYSTLALENMLHHQQIHKLTGNMV